MKDTRFIELLNLYLDHQLAPEEAAELEAEVMRNPSRRRTYDQYCRLQRGCSMLGEQERSTAPASQAFARSLRDVERKISAPRGSVWQQPAYAGLFAVSAMAACVAVVFIVNRAPSDSVVSPASGTVAAVAPQARTEAVAPVMVATTQTPSALVATVTTPFEGLHASGFGVARNAREAEIAASDPEALEWMKRVEQLPLQRIVVDDQTFETRATLHPDNRVFRSRQGMQGTAEFTAFQFQR